MQEPNDQDLVDVLAEEFLARRRNGEECRIDEYIARYPDRAEDIRDVFTALDFVHASQPKSDEVPSIVDYEVLREIGRGGMGIVYEARQISLDRKVALKVVPQTLLDNELSVQRFQLEARTAAQLEHDHIVPVYDFGFEKNLNYFSMRLIDGKGLDEVVQDIRKILEASGEKTTNRKKILGSIGENHSSGSLSGVFSPNSETRKMGSTAFNPAGNNRNRSYYHNAANICLNVANALAYAHQSNVMHRDIKPSNLLLDRSGKVWVADFGLAKTESQDLTTTGHIVGTLRFMSPERLEGVNDWRSDIYSLGMTLYELLALQPAFQSTNQLTMLDKIRDQNPLPLQMIDSGIPIDLQTIVAHSIEKDPRKRYQTAGAMAEDLQLFLQGRPIKARRVSQIEHAASWARRNPGIAGSLATVFLLLVSGLIGATYAALVFRDMANEQKRLVEVAETEADLRAQDLYYAEMNMAHEAANTSQGLARLTELLDQWRPENQRGKDRRGFEWFWLAAKSNLVEREVSREEVMGVQMNWSNQSNSMARRNFDPLPLAEFDFMRRPPGSHFNFKRFNRDGGLIGAISIETRTGEWQRLTVWDCKREEVVFEIKDEYVVGFDFNPVADQLALHVRLKTQTHNHKPYSSQFRIYSTKTWECTHVSDDIAQASSWMFARVEYRTDGQQIAVCRKHEESGLLAIDCYDTESWKVISSCHLPDVAQCYYMVWHPVEPILAIVGPGGNVSVWDTVKNTKVFAAGESMMSTILWHPVSRDLILGGNGAISIFDPKTLKLKLKFPVSTVRGVHTRISPNGREMLVSWNFKHAWLLDVSDLPEEVFANVRPFRFSKNYGLFWSPDEQLVSCSVGRPTTVWDVVGGKRITTNNRKFTAAGSSLGWNRHGQLMSKSGTQLQLWDRTGIEPTTVLDSMDGVNRKDESEAWPHSRQYGIPEILGELDNGKYLVRFNVKDRSFHLSVWDPQQQTHSQLFSADQQDMYAFAVSPNKQKVVVSLRNIGLVVIDIGSQKATVLESGNVNIEKSVSSIAWSKEGQFLATASNTSEIKIRETKSYEVVSVYKGAEGFILDLDWSPDGKRLASGSEDRKLRIWDTASGKSTLFAKLDSRVGAVAWSPSGKQLASLTQNGILRIWDARRGYRLFTQDQVKSVVESAVQHATSTSQ